MFTDNIQVLCASGSDCNFYLDAGPINESLHQCMNCALKFHSCITCSGVQFCQLDQCCCKGRVFSVNPLTVQLGEVQSLQGPRTTSPCIGTWPLLPEEHCFEYQCGSLLRRCCDCTCQGELQRYPTKMSKQSHHSSQISHCDLQYCHLDLR